MLRKIRSTGSIINRQSGSGRPRSVRIQETVETVQGLALSQEDAPQTHKMTRQIARQVGISQSSVVKIIHEELNLNCIKKRRAQQLTVANETNRLTECH